MLNAAIKLATSSGESSGAGNVTLKYDSVALVSNGPGVSIEAVVVARANGGVSCRIGFGPCGIVMMYFYRMNVISPSNVPRNVSSNLSGAGCIAASSARTSDGFFLG